MLTDYLAQMCFNVHSVELSSKYTRNICIQKHAQVRDCNYSVVLLQHTVYEKLTNWAKLVKYMDDMMIFLMPLTATTLYICSQKHTQTID